MATSCHLLRSVPVLLSQKRWMKMFKVSAVLSCIPAKYDHYACILRVFLILGIKSRGARTQLMRSTKPTRAPVSPALFLLTKSTQSSRLKYQHHDAERCPVQWCPMHELKIVCHMDVEATVLLRLNIHLLVGKKIQGQVE